MSLLCVFVTLPGREDRMELDVTAVLIDPRPGVSVRICRDGKPDVFLPPDARICVVPT